MMNLSVRKLPTRWALSGSFLALLSLATWAGGGGTGNNSNSNPDGQTNASSPGDEVTSLPMVSDVSGLTFLGSPRALRGLNLTLTGTGRVDVLRLGRGRVAVTLVGDFRVELDRVALANAPVELLFRGGVRFLGGLARLEINGGAPAFLAPDRVPLPLARLAAVPRLQGDLLTLDVAGLHAEQAHLVANFGRERVVLFQRMR